MAVHVEAIGANDGEESLDPEVGPVGAAAADLTGTKAAVGPEAFDRIK